MSDIIRRLKNRRGFWLLLLGGVLGIALIFIGEKRDESVYPSYAQSVTEDESLQNYTRQTEERLRSLIESMSGVDEVSVMVTLDGGSERVYAKNNVSASGGVSKEYVITESGGSEEAIALKDVYPRVRGVAVVCRGGDDPAVQAKIISVLSTLLGITTNHVSVSG